MNTKERIERELMRAQELHANAKVDVEYYIGVMRELISERESWYVGARVISVARDIADAQEKAERYGEKVEMLKWFLKGDTQ